MNYRLSEAAKADIIQIYLEGVRHFGLVQADAYHTMLETTFEILTKFPQMGVLRSDIEPPVRTHPCGSHVIVYHEMDHYLGILRVRHQSESWYNAPIH